MLAAVTSILVEWRAYKRLPKGRLDVLAYRTNYDRMDKLYYKEEGHFVHLPVHEKRYSITTDSLQGKASSNKKYDHYSVGHRFQFKSGTYRNEVKCTLARREGEASI